MIQHLLFDLDGTLVNSFSGITKSIQYAMEKLGKEIPSEESLIPCIGPPLITSFQHLLGLPFEEAEQAVLLYRERYGTKGKFELELYEGIPKTLQKLQQQGFILYVATSKPQVVAKEIIDHLGLTSNFSAIYGSMLDGQFKEKDTLLTHLLETEKMSPATAVMIGDRKFDMVGAVKNSITPLGVTYGFGSSTELIDSGASLLAHSPEEIITVLADKN